MSSVTDKLLYLQQTKSLIKDAIENKSSSIDLSDSTFREYVDAINGLVVGTGQLFAFELDEDGNLICCTNYDGNISVPYSLDEDGNLIPPFSTIDGLGDTVAKTIVEEREKGAFLSVEDLQKRGKVSSTLIEKLRNMHILDGLDESSQLSLF